VTNGDRYERAMSIFDELCDLPRDQRQKALEKACGDDHALKRDVLALLDSDNDSDDQIGETSSNQLDGWAAEFVGVDAVDIEASGQIGGYRIVRKIGEGGMGVIYEAEQESPRRRVALKLLRPGLLAPDTLRRFKNEAQVLGRLQHPGIAHVYESGVVRVNNHKQPYLAMEFIDGERITTYADQKKLDTRQRLALMVRVCDAVHHAHQKSVIHRDLKPANILVLAPESTASSEAAASGTASHTFESIGHPKVLDFGIARVTDADVQAVTMQTDPGQIVGTLAYMSPEQVIGDSTNIDTRSDVYALGVVLYQLLTDQLPLDLSRRSMAEAARIIRDDDPTPAGVIDKTLRGDVETILSKALEKNPEQRYDSAAQLAADIRRYLQDEPIVARPATTIYQIRKFARRNKAIVGGAMMTLLALIIGLIGTTWFALGERRANEATEKARDASVRAAHYASLSAASAALRENDITVAERHLNAAPEDLRGWEWHHLTAQLDSSVRSSRLAPQGKLTKFDFSRGRLQLWYSTTNDGAREIYTMRHSYDGTLTVEVRNPFTLDKTSEWSVSEILQATAIYPENQLQVTARESTTFRSGKTGRILRGEHLGRIVSHTRAPLPQHGLSSNGLWEHEKDGFRGQFVAMSNDAEWLLTAAESDVKIIPLRSTAQSIQLPPHPEYASNAVFAPDSRFVVTTGNDRRLQCFDLEKAGRLIWSRKDAHVDAILAVAISPDGKLLATGGQDKVLRFWDAETGAPRGARMGHKEPILAVSFDPNGEWVATASAERVMLWPPRDAADESVLWQDDWFTERVFHFPEQSLLVTTGRSGKASIWDPLACIKIGEMMIPRSEHNWETDARLLDDLKFEVEFHPNHTLVCDLVSGTITRRDDDAEIPFRSEPMPYRMAKIQTDRLGIKTVMPAMLILEQSNRVAAPTSERVLTIFDVTDGTPLGTLSGHTQPIISIDTLPNEARLITGSEDRTIRLWDLDTMEEVMDLRGHLDTVNWFAVTPDGKTIFSVSGDYTLRRWDTRSTSELYAERAEYQRVTDQLTPYVDELLDERNDPQIVLELISKNESLTTRERQIASHHLIRRGLSGEPPP